MWKDLKLTLRILKHQPLLSLVIIFTLMLSIGGSTAIFSVFNAVLLRKLPYPDPGQIYVMNSVWADKLADGNITPIELRPFYENSHPMVQAAALAWSQEVQIIGSDKQGHPSRRYGVTDQFFEVFGGQMYLGQPFKRSQNPGIIILTYATWRDLFASDPKIIGKAINAEGGMLVVLGVTRKDFDFPEKPGYFYLMNLGNYYDRVRAYRGFVRLKPGFSEKQFQSEVTSYAKKLGSDLATDKPTTLVARPFLAYLVGDLKPTVTILFGATLILLLIACINVTNILLSRAMVRTREMALREVLGAKRWHILRQLLTESLLLAGIGGMLGLLCANAAVQMLLRIAPPNLPRLDDVSIDGNVLLFAIGVSLLTGILVGLAPVWRLSRSKLNTIINESGRGHTGGFARTRVFNTFVMAETALAVLLVIGAGLLVRSYLHLTNTNPGFNPEKVLTLSMNLPGRHFSATKRNANGRFEMVGPYAPVADFYRELERRIQGLPGVKSVASTGALPLAPYRRGGPSLFILPGQPGMNSSSVAQLADNDYVSRNFFNALHIRQLSGRAFEPSDTIDSPGVAIVNRAFTQRFLSGLDPSAQRIRFTENRWTPRDTGFQHAYRYADEFQIVGVVEDVRYWKLAVPPEPRIYLSSEQWIGRNRAIVVRTSIANPETLVSPIRKEVAAMDRSLNPEFALFSTIVHDSLARERLGTLLMVLFGLTALILAVIGIYGLMAYSVVQRMGEIAVRSALGASSRNILMLVMSRGIMLAVGGIVLGVVVAIALRKVIATQLFGVTPLDMQVFGMTSVFLFIVAVVACFLPALRATRIPPADLLRKD
jgi:putative ABC transport system permease protein